MKGWMRVSNLDLTDPNQICPNAFSFQTLTTLPLRTCGRSVLVALALYFQPLGWSTHMCVVEL